MDSLIYIAVVLAATVIGSISGMGGGVIIKPVFDMLGKYSASEISVLTSCTMFAMSLVSVALGIDRFKEQRGSAKTVVCVAAGSLAGGYVGSALFELLTRSAADKTVKTVQNAVLLALVVTIIIYMRGEKKTLGVKNSFAGIPVGLFLGMTSAFLGIGGGPINVAALTFVFGFGIKTAVVCSLASVLITYITKLSSTIIYNGFAPFLLKLLPFVVAAGVCGALIGRTINKKASDKTVNTLFIAIQFIVLVMCAVNIGRSLLA